MENNDKLLTLKQLIEFFSGQMIHAEIFRNNQEKVLTFNPRKKHNHRITFFGNYKSWFNETISVEQINKKDGFMEYTISFKEKNIDVSPVPYIDSPFYDKDKNLIVIPILNKGLLPKRIIASKSIPGRNIWGYPESIEIFDPKACPNMINLEDGLILLYQKKEINKILIDIKGDLLDGQIITNSQKSEDENYIINFDDDTVEILKSKDYTITRQIIDL